MQRRVERGLGCLLARNLCETVADLLECERVVPYEAGVFLHEREGRVDALGVPLDRRRLSVPGDAVVRDRHVHDVGHVL